MTTQEPPEPGEELFTPFEKRLVGCLRLAKGRSSYSATHAIVHLKKAWILREIDQQMAVFRAITAEEEAAIAIIILLRERRYRGAASLKTDRHSITQALFPFLREVRQVLEPTWSMLKPRVRVFERESGDQLDVEYTLPGTNVTVLSEPPLGLISVPDSATGISNSDLLLLPQRLTRIRVTIGSTSDADRFYDPELLRQATVNFADILERRFAYRSTAQGYKQVLDSLRSDANQRNRLLYAGSSGWPVGVADCAGAIRARKNRTIVLLIIYCLLFPHAAKSVLVQQALLSFAKTVRALRKEDLSTPWESVG